MLEIILILQTFKHFKENIGFILSIMYNVLRAILLAKKYIFIFVFILIKKKRVQPKYLKKSFKNIFKEKKYKISIWFQCSIFIIMFDI